MLYLIYLCKISHKVINPTLKDIMPRLAITQKNPYGPVTDYGCKIYTPNPNRYFLKLCSENATKNTPITCLNRIRPICPHCKPKPCKAYRELPVSQFSQGKTCFHYREPLFSLQGPCFHYRDFPANPCTSLLGIAV